MCLCFIRASIEVRDVQKKNLKEVIENLCVFCFYFGFEKFHVAFIFCFQFYKYFIFFIFVCNYICCFLHVFSQIFSELI